MATKISTTTIVSNCVGGCGNGLADCFPIIIFLNIIFAFHFHFIYISCIPTIVLSSVQCLFWISFMDLSSHGCRSHHDHIRTTFYLSVASSFVHFRCTYHHFTLNHTRSVTYLTLLSSAPSDCSPELLDYQLDSFVVWFYKDIAYGRLCGPHDKLNPWRFVTIIDANGCRGCYVVALILMVELRLSHFLVTTTQVTLKTCRFGDIGLIVMELNQRHRYHNVSDNVAI